MERDKEMSDKQPHRIGGENPPPPPISRRPDPPPPPPMCPRCCGRELAADKSAKPGAEQNDERLARLEQAVSDLATIGRVGTLSLDAIKVLVAQRYHAGTNTPPIARAGTNAVDSQGGTEDSR